MGYGREEEFYIMALRLSKGEKRFRVFNYTFLAILGFMTAYPFYYTIISSFSDPETGTQAYLWVKDFYIANYELVLGTKGFGRAYFITVMRVVIGVPGMLLVTAAAAFTLARKELKDRVPIILFFFITMFFSGGLIPFYLVLMKVRLINTFWVFVVPGLFSVWTMIIMKTFFQSLPEGLVEAARIDGASYLIIFYRLILPLSIPMLAALGLFSAVGHWNDWFAGAFYVDDSRLYPLQTFLRMRILVGESTPIMSEVMAYPDRFGYVEMVDLLKLTPTSLKNAYIVVATVPILVVYPFLQKYFVKGVLIGAIKE